MASCTREDYALKGRITELIDTGALFDHLGVPPLDPDTDRVMIRVRNALYAHSISGKTRVAGDDAERV